MWMEIRSVAIFKYFLDYNVIIVIMHSNVDVNQINIDFQVFFIPQCYYHYCSYVIRCRWKSDRKQFSRILLDQNVIIIIMHSNVYGNQINSNFQALLRLQCYYHYYSYGAQCERKSDQQQFSSILWTTMLLSIL